MERQNYFNNVLLEQLNCNEIIQCLQTNGYDKWCHIFKDQQIDGTKLMNLTELEMRTWGLPLKQTRELWTNITKIKKYAGEIFKPKYFKETQQSHYAISISPSKNILVEDSMKIETIKPSGENKSIIEESNLTREQPKSIKYTSSSFIEIGSNQKCHTKNISTTEYHGPENPSNLLQMEKEKRYGNKLKGGDINELKTFWSQKTTCNGRTQKVSYMELGNSLVLRQKNVTESENEDVSYHEIGQRGLETIKNQITNEETITIIPNNGETNCNTKFLNKYRDMKHELDHSKPLNTDDKLLNNDSTSVNYPKIEQHDENGPADLNNISYSDHTSPLQNLYEQLDLNNEQWAQQNILSKNSKDEITISNMFRNSTPKQNNNENLIKNGSDDYNTDLNQNQPRGTPYSWKKFPRIESPNVENRLKTRKSFTDVTSKRIMNEHPKNIKRSLTMDVENKRELSKFSSVETDFNETSQSIPKVTLKPQKSNDPIAKEERKSSIEKIKSIFTKSKSKEIKQPSLNIYVSTEIENTLNLVGNDVTQLRKVPQKPRRLTKNKSQNNHEYNELENLGSTDSTTTTDTTPPPLPKKRTTYTERLCKNLEEKINTTEKRENIPNSYVNHLKKIGNCIELDYICSSCSSLNKCHIYISENDDKTKITVKTSKENKQDSVNRGCTQLENAFEQPNENVMAEKALKYKKLQQDFKTNAEDEIVQNHWRKSFLYSEIPDDVQMHKTVHKQRDEVNSANYLGLGNETEGSFFKKYFFNISREEAMLLLQNAEDGSFIFRPSNSKKYHIAATIKTSKHFFNIGLEKTESGEIVPYAEENLVQFASIDKFVEYYQNHPMLLQGKGEVVAVILNREQI